ncbi:hypothetical protein IVB33_03100 [Bradyrhizobium sp. 24]|uniref:hypothetical protein n=1 Tax=unclassified Bradyrhizobium TaxID=2631580 RepID=UPI001FFC0D88|nr:MULTISPECIES: hypothetical protein [unclassified Bradyrhizobium]MCK1296969.1 hypothetical protein [Bradyrhizobium sp. 37]MCK1377455.1 hypothetical protein [Bradyrhizobium sp. 24]MCK1775038.1 hypothetical protein [Bradyrhizobium sp. 134]
MEELIAQREKFRAEVEYCARLSRTAPDRQTRALFERLGEMVQEIETTIAARAKLSGRWE